MSHAFGTFARGLIINTVKANANQEINNLTRQINTLNAQLTGVQSTIPVLTSGISNVASNTSQLDDKFNNFIKENNKSLGIRDLQQSNLSKEFDKKLSEFERQSSLTSQQRFDEFTKQNNEALKIRDLKQSESFKGF